MYLLTPFILQNFKKFLELNQSYEDYELYWSFSCAKLKKILTVDPES